MLNVCLSLFLTHFRSSTGKTTLVKQALAKLDQRCQAVLINVRPDEVAAYQKVHPKLKLIECTTLREGLEQVADNSYLVVEDIVTMSKKDEESLRVLINYRAHHDRIRVICVAHMLFRNYLLTLVPLFNYIIFTLSNSSRNLLKTAAVYGFHLESAKTSKWLAIFSKQFRSKEGGFIFVACTSVELHHCKATGETSVLLDANDDDDDDDDDSRSDYDEGGNVMEAKTKTQNASRRTTLERRFNECFSAHAKAPLARALFSIISKVLLAQVGFRDYDLSLAFNQTRKPGSVRRVSVVDYVSALLDSAPVAKPRLDLLVLHRYLSARIKIPKIFVQNHHFYDAASDITSDEEDDEDDDDDDDDDKKHGRKRIAKKRAKRKKT